MAHRVLLAIPIELPDQHGNQLVEGQHEQKGHHLHRLTNHLSLSLMYINKATLTIQLITLHH